MVLLDRLDDHEVREWYAARDAAEGWSRAVLETIVANRLHLRQGVAPSNFPATLPGAESDLVQEITRDPYVFDFVRLQPGSKSLRPSNLAPNSSSDLPRSELNGGSDEVA